jgi:sulfur-carrier protein
MARLLYFGRLMDTLGTSVETLALPAGVADTSALRSWLDKDRQLGGMLMEKTIRVAINDTIVPEPWPIADSDDIAFLPPVGGG